MARPQVHNLRSHDQCLRTTQTNDPNAALTFGGGNGTNRVFESSVHDTSFTSRMLKKSASFVLASLRSSTYRIVRLASSLAAAFPDGLFEHPAWHRLAKQAGRARRERESNPSMSRASCITASAATD